MINTGKRIFSVDDLSDGEISRLFFASRNINSLWQHRAKKNEEAVLMTAFFEPSTRTRLSFEMAAHRLGVRILSFHAGSSSMSKGENEDETINNLLALKPNILVIRQSKKLDSQGFINNDESAIINGGDGTNEHPTQALLDCFTLLNYFKADNLAGKQVAIVGDVLHSRVAHSNIKLMARLGASISLIAPNIFKMTNCRGPIQQLSAYEEINEEIDVVMCIRTQKERLNGLCFDESDFYKNYGLTIDRFLKLGKQCIVLHPGPMNLGVEIDQVVARHPRSLINQQVQNGVLVRAALLDYCLA